MIKPYALATIGDSSLLHLAGMKRIGVSDRWRWSPFCGAHIRVVRGRRRLSVVTAQQRPLDDLQCTRCKKAVDSMPTMRGFVEQLYDPTPAESYGGTVPEGETI